MLECGLRCWKESRFGEWADLVWTSSAVAVRVLGGVSEPQSHLYNGDPSGQLLAGF